MIFFLELTLGVWGGKPLTKSRAIQGNPCERVSRVILWYVLLTFGVLGVANPLLHRKARDTLANVFPRKQVRFVRTQCFGGRTPYFTGKDTNYRSKLRIRQLLGSQHHVIKKCANWIVLLKYKNTKKAQPLPYNRLAMRFHNSANFRSNLDNPPSKLHINSFPDRATAHHQPRHYAKIRQAEIRELRWKNWQKSQLLY